MAGAVALTGALAPHRSSAGDSLLFKDLFLELCNLICRVSMWLEKIDDIYGEINISDSTPWALSHLCNQHLVLVSRL